MSPVKKFLYAVVISFILYLVVWLVLSEQKSPGQRAVPVMSPMPDMMPAGRPPVPQAVPDPDELNRSTPGPQAVPDPDELR